ncbi:MAG: GTP pyrophosphokinase family protein [Nocardioides sp.]|uniref:GTP pyrophosphokinase n=1 Tax=Nocardioides sp. TaxID=35761 RepID=UPI003F0579BE
MATEQAPGVAQSKEIEDLRLRGRQIGEFLMVYKFALEELTTKVEILREEINYRKGSSPIEHVSTRLKTMDSIVAKAERRGIDFNPVAIAANLFDIAGLRIVCSFISDCYEVTEMLTAQTDVKVLEVKDYIADPKANGYRSLHVIVEVPVFLSTGVRPTPVEIQVRTVAMDFWASLEHKIYYKYAKDVPAHLGDELTAAALAARELDEKMQSLHREVRVGRPRWV